MNKQRFTTFAFILMACLTSFPALAYQSGDMILRAGLANVNPDNNDSESLMLVPGGTVDVDDDTSLGISFTYMLNDDLGVGILGASPFKHDVQGSGALAGAGKVAEVKHLPPTVTLQYHFDTGSKFHPFVGAGINYTHFFSDKTTGIIAASSIDFSASWGLAFEAGFDYDLGSGWSVGAQAFYIDIDSDATIKGGIFPTPEKIEVNVDPWVFMVSVGKRF